MADRGNVRIDFKTTNCIVTGERATIWTGHVVVVASGRINEERQLPHFELGVTAGFATREVQKNAKSDDRGCFGEWYPHYGLKWDAWGFEEAVPS